MPHTDKKLSACRGIVTKTCTHLSELCVTEPLDTAEIGVVAETLRQQFERLEKLNEEFEDEADPAELDAHFERAEEYRSRAQRALALAKLKGDGQARHSQNTHMSVRLPKLNVPTFDGNGLFWQEFFESFSVSVDRQPISEVEKFQYLKSCLKGEASSLISGMSLTAANYQVALELLSKRYGSKQRLLRAHIRALLALSTPDAKKCSSLRNFVDNISKHMRVLETLDLDSDNYDIFLSEVLITKVPTEIKHEWAKLDEEDMTLSQLLKIIEAEARKLEIVKSPSLQPPPVFQHKPAFQGSQTGNRLRTTSLVNTKARKSDGDKCKICSAGHPQYRCPIFVNAEIPKRFDLVKEKRLCYNCLDSHLSKECPSTSRCRTCEKKHHTLLHYERKDDAPTAQSNTCTTKINSERPSVESEEACEARISNGSTGPHTALPIVPIPLKASTGGIRTINALLDSGSDRTFIRSHILVDVSHQVLGTQKFNVQGFGGPTIKENCELVSVEVEFSQGHFLPVEMVASSQMTKIRPSTMKLAKESVQHLNLPIVLSDESVDIIIGADNYYLFATGNSVELTPTLRLVETNFGWTPHGVAGRSSDQHFSQTVLFVSSMDPQDEYDLKRFWDDELAGILPSVEAPDTDKMVMEQFNNNVEYVNNRYMVQLPWIPNINCSSTYKHAAKVRLAHTVKKLINTGKLAEYDSILREYLHLGIIETCEVEDTDTCRYIPHHAVIRHTDDSTKLRIVFDGSAKEYGQISLNDCLHDGPNLFPSLLGILLRFRLFEYAVTADIEKAFLQIGVAEKDREFLRFMWYDEVPEKTVWPKGPPRSFRFCRVPFGIRASPFLLNATILCHLNTCRGQYEETVQHIENNIYVDDLIISVPLASQAEQVIHETEEIFQQMSMSMHKWHSNAETILSGREISQNSKILGITWHSSKDTLSVEFLSKQSVETKRHLASLVCGMFDPLGLFSPFTIKLKLILQECWQLGLDWDSPLPKEIQNHVKEVCSEMGKVNGFRLPRWLGIRDSDARSMELHVYGDASTHAYCTCAYIVIESGIRHLVASKTRVAPKKAMTMPRLELMAALITARLSAELTRQLPSGLRLTVKCFSDSQVILAWINGVHKLYRQFVQNRVNEIRKLVPPSQWQYINTKQNPADLATRPHPVSAWLMSSLWWNGPQPQMIQESSAEYCDATHASSEEVNTTLTVRRSECVISFERFSNYRRLLHCLCYVLRFLGRLRFEYIDDSQRYMAERLAIRLHQRECFPRDYHYLESNMSIPRDSKLRNLNPFIDEHGLLRMRGRLQESDLSFEAMHPTILSKEHRLSTLYVRHVHESNLHAGVQTMTAIIQQTHYVIQCRRLCKYVIFRCVKCQRYRSKPTLEKFAPLPVERVDGKAVRPFSYTGLDYLGPITRLSSGQKLYVLLFTCMQIRAIHLEVTVSLSTEDFFLAFTRFVSRRGDPIQLRSDNAKTFRAASVRICSSHRVSWKFNTEKAPWTGGSWERLVRSVKTVLRYTVAQWRGNFQQIETFVCHAESIINHRPLTYCTGNEQGILPLSPHDFLAPSANAEVTDDLQLKRGTLLDSLHCNTKLAQRFWRRWKREYLTLLNRNVSQDGGRKLSVGDVVLVNEGPKRQYWPLAMVEALCPGRDGKVRTVKIRMNAKSFNRPTKLLHHLEL